MPLRNLLTIFLAFPVSLACYFEANRNRYASSLAEAMNLISAFYVEDVGFRDLYENAMQGMAEKLDPYSAYIDPGEYQHFLEGLDQEFGGIGILVEVNRDTRRLTVMSPLVDTPAYRAGMRAGDTILQINGRDTEGMTLKDAVDLIRGPPGTPVTLSVRHIGEQEPVALEVTRDIIPIESVLGDRRAKDGTWSFELEQDPRITYVRLITFGEHTVKELTETLQERDVEALVLDLRDNAGGLLAAAVDVCDLFVDDGVIVSTRGRGGKVRQSHVAHAETKIGRDVPVVVLVNHFSASASEIVAACLQDHGRAKIVGQRTWGKGTVQNIIQLEGGRAALKLTTASYWRPSGKNIHRSQTATDEDTWGVTPDPEGEVVLTDEQADKVRRYHRSRDALLNGAAPADGQDDSAAEKAEPFYDPQLRKAIEYLQEQLGPKGEDATEDAADA